MSMGADFLGELRDQLVRIKQEDLFKEETELFSPQNSSVILAGEQTCINLCANNYLGLANHPAVVEAARSALSQFGFGMASVRFICGTQDLHRALERKISDFLNSEDSILYSSCFDANTGLFETLLGPSDAIISDSLNHASIIDGVRLCKATRYRYANNDMAELEDRLQEARNSRYRLIATDGVFSMDGSVADLRSICDLAEKYEAMVMVDDSHAVGVLGDSGRGTPEYCGVEGRIDILTGTLGKALGGASGGYVCGRREVVAWLRQRSRPYLFSNTLAPVVAAGSLAAIEFVMSHPEQRDKLHRNSAHFRQGMSAAGFDLPPGAHPIVPVMIRDASRSVELARRLRGRGVMVTPFSYPVVPHGEDRIRTQISALHDISELDYAIEQFESVARELGLKG